MFRQRLAVARREGLAPEQKVAFDKAVGPAQLEPGIARRVADQDPPRHRGPIADLNPQLEAQALGSLGVGIRGGHGLRDAFGRGHRARRGKRTREQHQRQSERPSPHRACPASFEKPA